MKKIENWEKEFDERVANNYQGQDPYWPDWEGVKSFIHSLLAAQKKEHEEEVKNLKSKLEKFGRLIAELSDKYLNK